MIVNPFAQRERMRVIEGTRILLDDFNLLRTTVTDPYQPKREWRIVGVYAPLTCRSTRGIRVKVVDEQEVVSFIEQMPLEVLLGMGRIGQRCPWSGRNYVNPAEIMNETIVMDDDDVEDDLLDREHIIRAQCPNGVIPDGVSFTRRLHMTEGEEFEDEMSLTTDGDPTIGLRPDLRLDTVSQRWGRVNRKRYQWKAA